MTSHEARVDGVLVVGGGYAGVHAAQAAAQGGANVTVVDPTGDYDFVPRLAAVAGGTAPVDDAQAPLAELVDEVRLGSAVGIADGSVLLDDGVRLAADAVIITAGAVPTTPPIDGIDLAWPLRTSADAFALRHVIDDAESLVVVGGGATGVQLAGAAADRPSELTVHLVESDETLLAQMGGLGAHARRILEDRGVIVHVGTAVERIDESGVDLDSGERLDGAVAWAAGFTARADDLGVETHDDGRILVDEDLRIVGMQRTFAAGDIAMHVDADGSPLPASAQIAVQAGRHAGENARRLVNGEELKPGRFGHRGWVLDLGGWRGVAQVGPLAIESSPLDRLAPLLHFAIDLKHLGEIGGLAAIAAFRPGAPRTMARRDPDEALDVLDTASTNRR